MNDFTTTRSVGKDGIVLRDKHGPSGIIGRKEPTYLDQVELYRVQLWRGILRQGDGYPNNLTRTKLAFQAKLMKYAKLAGKNYLDAFDYRRTLEDKDFLIGWAGKKLKDKMRKHNCIHLGKKEPKVRRKVYSNHMLYLALRDVIITKNMLPVEALPADGMLIEGLVSVTYCRNGKKGHLSLLDESGKSHVIHWQESGKGTAQEILAAWNPLQIVKSKGGTPQPLFRPPRLMMNRNPAPVEITPLQEPKSE